ncbi:SRPBCC family protein [Nocardioides sambongensis]|uniref:SRPBCC family protein n=1 Tax=Nocardioides sambongensis TaxID=2589074 RepID=UPI00112672A9|nr:SRPBCC family protein [Nocardioides sambongensis]
MTTVTRTFTVRPDPAAVLAYLEDFSHAEEWDPGTVSCTREDSGPIRVGSRFHNVSRIAGISTELTYTLERRDETTVEFQGSNDSATTSDTITVVPAPDGTGSEITYTAVISMKGVAKLADPAMKLVFEKIGNDTVESMTRALDELA